MTTDLSKSTIDASLLERYDRPGPRYTSYPTAVEFDTDLGPEEATQRLASLSADGEASLYIHLPFCDHRCHFCGCHVVATKHVDVAETDAPKSPARQPKEKTFAEADEEVEA